MAEVIKSVIAGLHKTKIGANREVCLIVKNVSSILHNDPNCMLVKVPLLENIPQREYELT